MKIPQLLISGALLGLTGCGVYTPLLPTTPLVQRGQVEITTAVAPFPGLVNLTTSPKPTSVWLPAAEGSVAWAPIRHLSLLVSGATTYVGQLRPAATQYVRNRHWAASAGWHTTRAAPTGNWYVAVLVGAGRGNSALAKEEAQQDGGLFSTPGLAVSFYEARYRKQFIQAYATRATAGRQGVSVTGAVRFTHLSFDRLQRYRRVNGADLPPAFVPAAGAPTAYLEPAVSLRWGANRLQGLVGMGVAIALQHPHQPPKGQLAPYQQWAPMVAMGAVVRLGR